MRPFGGGQGGIKHRSFVIYTALEITLNLQIKELGKGTKSRAVVCVVFGRDF